MESVPPIWVVHILHHPHGNVTLMANRISSNILKTMETIIPMVIKCYKLQFFNGLAAIKYQKEITYSLLEEPRNHSSPIRSDSSPHILEKYRYW